ncbi:hypothetical protein [Streptomyces sp. NPDC001978]|uniref:hypothetical protein n=1 Tax=Streptomyces sp. NPDC001978 TaxID=3364627 RepID=UPI0036AD15F0
MPGGPIGCQREEVDQVALGSGEQVAEFGDGQLDHWAVALIGIDREPDRVAEALRN